MDNLSSNPFNQISNGFFSGLNKVTSSLKGYDNSTKLVSAIGRIAAEASGQKLPECVEVFIADLEAVNTLPEGLSVIGAGNGLHQTAWGNGYLAVSNRVMSISIACLLSLKYAQRLVGAIDFEGRFKAIGLEKLLSHVSDTAFATLMNMPLIPFIASVLTIQKIVMGVMNCVEYDKKMEELDAEIDEIENEVSDEAKSDELKEFENSWQKELIATLEKEWKQVVGSNRIEYDIRKVITDLKKDNVSLTKKIDILEKKLSTVAEFDKIDINDQIFLKENELFNNMKALATMQKIDALIMLKSFSDKISQLDKKIDADKVPGPDVDQAQDNGAGVGLDLDPDEVQDVDVDVDVDVDLEPELATNELSRSKRQNLKRLEEMINLYKQNTLESRQNVEVLFNMSAVSYQRHLVDNLQAVKYNLSLKMSENNIELMANSFKVIGLAAVVATGYFGAASVVASKLHLSEKVYKVALQIFKALNAGALLQGMFMADREAMPILTASQFAEKERLKTMEKVGAGRFLASM